MPEVSEGHSNTQPAAGFPTLIQQGLCSHFSPTCFRDLVQQGYGASWTGSVNEFH